MSKAFKVILGAIGFCIVGAILIDCNIQTTGATLIILGILGIIVGPMASEL